jgi:hypothetical protein
MRHIAARDDRLRPVEAAPMELERTTVTHEAIVSYLAHLSQIVEDVPPEFIFNMDEMGHQDYADAMKVTVFIPADDPRDVVPLPVSRAGKRITLVATICADGTYIRPLVIIPRKTVDQDLRLFGINDENCLIRFQESAFIDRELFDLWMEDVFVPEVRKKRESLHYAGPCLLLLDNCTAHDSDYCYDIALDENISLEFIPPHSSNQLQPCDLCLFGVTKRLIHKINNLASANPQSIHIARVLAGYQAACTLLNVRASFQNAGLEYFINPQDSVAVRITPESLRCLMEPVTAQEIKDFREEAEDSDGEIPEYLAILELQAEQLIATEEREEERLRRQREAENARSTRIMRRSNRGSQDGTDPKGCRSRE